jgi:hypothetical protein
VEATCDENLLQRITDQENHEASRYEPTIKLTENCPGEEEGASKHGNMDIRD